MPSRAASPAVLIRAALVLALALPAAAQLDAEFSADVVAGSNPLTVQFSDLSTGATPIGWTWDFGDGALSNLQNPQHTYTAPGSYTVKLTVLQSLIVSDVEVKPDLIQVGPATLTAGFSVDVTAGVVPLAVQFTDTSTGPVDGWLWDFGDGAQSDLQDPQHTFTAPGSFTVTLTPLAGGQVGTPLALPDLISVDPVSLDTSFSVSSTSVAEETLLTFQHGQGGTPPTQVRWSLGDGAELEGDSVEHLIVPQEAGGLDVTLTVSYFGQQETVTASDLIETAPGPFGRLRRISSGRVVDVATGDLDEDGDRDVVAILLEPGLGSQRRLGWFRNTGSGDFAGEATLDTPPRTFQRLVVEDLDGDGHLDVMACATNSAWFLAGNGSGGFAPAAAKVPVSGYTDLSAGDVDTDGDLDLAGVRADTWLDVLGNSGPADFALTVAVANTNGDTVERALCVDMDADGDADIVGSDRLVLARYWRNLDGLGQTWQRWALANTASTGLAVADVEDDGDLDLLLSGWLPSSATWVPFENGLPGTAQAYPAEDLCLGAFDAADTDGDGVVELVRARFPQAPSQQPAVPAALSRLGGEAQPPVGVVSGLPLLSDVELADLDGDGLLDLLVADDVHGAGWQPRTPVVRWAADVGPGLAGTGGVEPRLDGYGALAPHETVTVALADALPGTTTFLVLGTTALAAPFKGGLMTPFPELVLALPVGANGHHVTSASWPGGIPAGVPAYAQHWVLDAGGPVGFAASQAVLGTSQD